MHDRGIIKWAPFASVINGNILLKEIKEEKSRIIKPTLSNDQIENLEETIIEAYTGKIPVDIYFYKCEHIYKIYGFITKINATTKEITINNQKNLLFSNIVRIIKKNT